MDRENWKVVVVGAGVLAIGAVVFVLYQRGLEAEEQRVKEAHEKTLRERAQPAAPGPHAEAEDAVGALRALWKIAVSVNDAGGAWAKCHDETPGYEDMRSCFNGAEFVIEQAKGRLPAGAAASMGCGKEIEKTIRGFIDGQTMYFADTKKWLDEREARLKTVMRGKSLWKACDVQEALCAGRPISIDDKYVQWLKVNGIECTKRVFMCGVYYNECDVGKVAARLELGPDAKPAGTNGELRVRATGKLVF